MRSSTKIRTSFKSSEIPTLYAIEKRCFTKKFRWDKSDFVAALKKEDVWISEFNNEVVGFLIAENTPEFGYVTTVNVDPSHRGKGYGAELMMVAEKHYAEIGKREMRLDVHPDNPAQILYFNLGYRVCGVKLDYYSDSSLAVRMVKTLLPAKS
jgi:ribosomal protein S18 acetylase RimI-like enzyme